MVPKLQDFHLSVDSLLVSTANTLEDLADITQVERVMRLVGCRLKLQLYASVDRLSGIDELTKLGFNILSETAEESSQNLVEDHGNGIRSQVGVGEVVVMALETSGNG